MWAVVQNDVVVEVIRTPKDVIIDGVQHPKEIFRLWTQAELEAIGVYPVVAAPLPDNRYYTVGASTFNYDPVLKVVNEELVVYERDLVALQNSLLNEVKRKREQVAAGGLIYNTIPVPTDPITVSKMNLIANAISLGNPFPAKLILADMENTPRNLTQTQLNNVVKALATHFVDTDNAADDHENAIAALTTVAEAQAYDITTGWPANPVISDPAPVV